MVSIHNKQLSGTLVEGVITCIPESGKLPNDLKNCRLLTLLNSVYKFFSGMIANRQKPELSFFINEDHRDLFLLDLSVKTLVPFLTV